jgi:hypothetical protein
VLFDPVKFVRRQVWPIQEPLHFSHARAKEIPPPGRIDREFGPLNSAGLGHEFEELARPLSSPLEFVQTNFIADLPDQLDQPLNQTRNAVADRK